MPVAFKIADEEYHYPEGWQDATLQKHMESFDAYTKPDELIQLERCKTEEAVREVYRELVVPNYPKIAQFYKDYVHHWTGISKEILGEIEGSEVKLNNWDSTLKQGWQWIETLYIQIANNFTKSEKQCTVLVDHIYHNEKKWYLPTKHLRGANLNGFIELNQAQLIAKQLKNNQTAAFPKIVCILLRSKEGAKFNPQQMQREPEFMNMSMDKVFKIGFFLLKLNEKLLLDFLTSMGISHLSQLQPKHAQE